MQGNDLVFAFRDKNFRFWKPDGAYNAIISGEPYFFKFAPTGWQDFSIENILNDKYWCVDRKVTAPANYVEDAAQILKNIFYKMGLNEDVYLVMAKQQIDYTKPPTAVIAATSGSVPFADGANTGTITGTPGDTVYIKVEVNGPSTADRLTGSIGSGLDAVGINMTSVYSPSTYIKTFPASGIIPYTIDFTNDSTTAVGNITVVDADGNTTGSYGYWYKHVYTGQVDGSTFSHDGPSVIAATLEEGFVKYLKSSENTILEIPMSDAEAINVKMDGIKLHEKYNYILIDGTEITLSGVGSTWAAPFTFVSNEGQSTGIVNNSQIPENHDWFSGGGAFNVYDNYTLWNTNNYAVEFMIEGVIEFVCTTMVSSPAYAARFRYYTSTMVLADQNTFNLGQTGAMTAGQTYNLPYSVTVTLQPDEKLYMAGIFYNGVGANVGITFTENSTHSIKFLTRKKTTYIKALRLQTLFKKLIPFITNSKYAAMESAYLEAIKDFVITCGNGIRGLDDAVMKISFSDFFQFLDSIDAVGISEFPLNSLLMVDIAKKEDLYDNDNYIDLPAPQQRPKLNYIKRFNFNSLEIGYPEIRNDVGAVNGNEEFNCKFSFTTGPSISPAKIDKVSKIKGSCYEIENIRVTTFDKDTTDFKSDNDLYALAILPTYETDPLINYSLDRRPNDTATGLIEPETIFNLPLSPKRNIKRNASFFRSSLFRGDQMYLNYSTADKNNKVVSDGIVEKDNFNIGSEGEIFFYPISIDAEFDVPVDWIEQLDKPSIVPGKRKLIRFPFMGIYWKAMMLKSNFTPITGATQSFQLMFTKDNDINKLIEYFG